MEKMPMVVKYELDQDSLDFIRRHEDDRPMCLNYLRMRRMGESHRMAEMLATRKFPGLNTDTSFLAGHCNGNQFESCPKLGDRYRAVAESQGVSTTGKVYMRGLASFPGDPRAWVDSKGDVVRVAEERGWGVDGSVNVRRRDVEPEPDVDVAPDIVRSCAASLMAESPGLSEGEAMEQAREIRSGRGGSFEPLVQPIPDEAREFCPNF